MSEKRKKEAFEKEKAEIEARGENPYQVFLQRDIDKKYERDVREAKERIERKKQEVIDRIAKDDERQRKIDAKSIMTPRWLKNIELRLVVILLRLGMISIS